MRRAATTTTDSLAPPLQFPTGSLGRSAFHLSDAQVEPLIHFLVTTRHILRRATRDGHDTADVLDAYSAALSDWPPHRRAAALRAVLAGFDDAHAAGAVFRWGRPVRVGEEMTA